MSSDMTNILLIASSATDNYDYGPYDPRGYDPGATNEDELKIEKDVCEKHHGEWKGEWCKMSDDEEYIEFEHELGDKGVFYHYKDYEGGGNEYNEQENRHYAKQLKEEKENVEKDDIDYDKDGEITLYDVERLCTPSEYYELFKEQCDKL